MSEVAVAHPFPPPRLLILIALWGLFVLWMFFSAIGDLSMMGDNSSPDYRYKAIYAIAWLSLDLWALAAAALVGLVAFNPFEWLNGKRLIIGCMAFAVMLGRLAGGWVVEWLIYTHPSPNALATVTPFILLIGGVMIILTIAVLVGLLFGFFVGVPVMLFNQILAFDNVIQVYRYQADGLAGYIVRAVYWLRNERRPAAAPS